MKELKVGLLGLVSILVFIFGISFLKRSNLLKPSNSYYAIYQQAYGLQPDDPVYVNGVQVGKVSTIELMNDMARSVFVTIEMDDSERIPTTSTAILFSEDFLGEKSIKLIWKEDNGVYHEAGDTVNTQLEKEMLSALSDQFTPITQKLEAMIPKISQLLDNVNAILDTQFNEDLHGTLANLEVMTGELNYLLANDSSDMNKILGNVESATGNLAAQEEQINNIIANFSALSAELKEAQLKELLNNANASVSELNKALTAVNEGDGVAQAVLHDEHFREELIDITENVNKLLVDFKQYPSRYVSFSVFGKKDPKEKAEKVAEKKMAKEKDKAEKQE